MFFQTDIWHSLWFCQLLLLCSCFYVTIHFWNSCMDKPLFYQEGLFTLSLSASLPHTVLLCVLYHHACRAKAVSLPTCTVLGESRLTEHYILGHFSSCANIGNGILYVESRSCQLSSPKYVFVFNMYMCQTHIPSKCLYTWTTVRTERNIFY